MPALLTVAFLIKTIKTVCRLESHDVILVSINPADELTILLIFVNSEHLLMQSQWESCHMRTKCKCRHCVAEIWSNLAKAIIHVYKYEVNGGRFERFEHLV